MSRISDRPQCPKIRDLLPIGRFFHAEGEGCIKPALNGKGVHHRSVALRTDDHLAPRVKGHPDVEKRFKRIFVRQRYRLAEPTFDDSLLQVTASQPKIITV